MTAPADGAPSMTAPATNHASPEIQRSSFAGSEHHYGKKCALEDLSLSLPAGATIGLIGPDGVGKSTLLGLVAGSKRLQQGSIRVLGADLARKREREALLPRLAFMPQGLGKNLYPTLSVHENVDFFGRLFGLSARATRGSYREAPRGNRSGAVRRSRRPASCPAA